jgi:DNA-binding NarL/FixJ family response regulator
MATRVLLADHQVLFRDAVHALLERSGGFEVVAAVTDGREALDALRKRRPDLVIAEAQLPRLSGHQLAEQARLEGSNARFILLAQNTGPRQVGEAFKAGAAGYVCKTDSASQLIAAIEDVTHGRTHVSPSVTDHLVKLAVGEKGLPRRPDALTSREREILQLVAEGMSSKEVSETLHVSVRTVDTHRANIMEKLGIHRVSGLVRYAIREGILNP